MKLDAYESALLLAKMAIKEIDQKLDLRSQLSVIRLQAAVKSLEGNVDAEAFEQKILGPHWSHRCVCDHRKDGLHEAWCPKYVKPIDTKCNACGTTGHSVTSGFLKHKEWCPCIAINQ